jgi:putative acetyltransferase
VSAAILRPYRDDDYEITVALWRVAWDAAMPDIDFTARLPWWRERWIKEIVPNNVIKVAEAEGRPIGFIVIDPRSGYLDQIVVAPEHWGSGIADRLLDAAKRVCPSGVFLYVNQDNARAIRFYERAGFARAGAGINPFSGRPTWRYEWRPGSH